MGNWKSQIGSRGQKRVQARQGAERFLGEAFDKSRSPTQGSLARSALAQLCSALQEAIAYLRLKMKLTDACLFPSVDSASTKVPRSYLGGTIKSLPK
jgi:hypothetical protein